jgi:hypothetical protein
VGPEGLGELEQFISLIGSRTRDLPACSIVPNHYAATTRLERQSYIWTAESRTEISVALCALCLRHVLPYRGPTDYTGYCMYSNMFVRD